jgi:hypothetical protein
MKLISGFIRQDRSVSLVAAPVPRWEKCAKLSARDVILKKIVAIGL